MQFMVAGWQSKKEIAKGGLGLGRNQLVQLNSQIHSIEKAQVSRVQHSVGKAVVTATQPIPWY
jgi:hypothetical protein